MMEIELKSKWDAQIFSEIIENWEKSKWQSYCHSSPIHFLKLHFWKYTFRKTFSENTCPQIHFQKIHFRKVHLYKIHFLKKKNTFGKYTFEVIFLAEGPEDMWIPFHVVCIWMIFKWLPFEQTFDWKLLRTYQIWKPNVETE